MSFAVVEMSTRNSFHRNLTIEGVVTIGGHLSRRLHKTDLGEYRLGDSVKALGSSLGKKLRGQVQLILTSPPFPLNRKKSCGNLAGEEYKEWLAGLAPLFSELLTDDGSIVIEMGNSWMPGRPVQSLLHLESWIGFGNNPKADLRLCQQFVCFNPSRLPAPSSGSPSSASV